MQEWIRRQSRGVAAGEGLGSAALAVKTEAGPVSRRTWLPLEAGKARNPGASEKKAALPIP